MLVAVIQSSVHGSSRKGSRCVLRTYKAKIFVEGTGDEVIAECSSRPMKVFALPTDISQQIGMRK
eukprot:scaffold76182_cov13-Tisochrysis_lutea.AAC.1